MPQLRRLDSLDSLTPQPSLPMLTPVECQTCRAIVEVSAEDANPCCPRCGQPVHLQAQLSPISAKAPGVNPAEAKIAPGGSSTWDYLVSVRQDTCYKALRAVITFVFGIWALLSLIMVISAPLMWVFGDETFDVAFFGFGSGLISGILCAAVWQASILLIDIADLLIHIGRSKR